MRVIIIGHSMIHDRQHSFFRALAREGHDVLLVAPWKWLDLKLQAGPRGLVDVPPPYTLHSSEERFSAVGLQVIHGEGDMYTYDLLGLEAAIKGFEPDCIYIQQEMECKITAKCINLAKANGWPVAVFVWENLRPLGTEASELLAQVNLCVCGNDRAAELHAAAPRRVFLPQVGVDTDHFWYRPGVERDIDVGFIGRAVPEKGINEIREAWPSAKIPPWRPWRELPWAYSHLKVCVCYSKDTATWREQAMSYVNVEGLSCGCAVVTSDGGAIPWWLGGGFCEPCPGAVIVPQGQPGRLRDAMKESLEHWWELGDKGRDWVKANLGSKVIAQRLSSELMQVVKAGIHG